LEITMLETKQYKQPNQNIDAVVDHGLAVRTYKELLVQEHWHIAATKAEFIIVPQTCETSTFQTFIASPNFIPFLRSTLGFIEDVHGFHDYHLCIHPRAVLVGSLSLKQSIWPNKCILNSAKKIGWYLFIIADKSVSGVHVPDSLSELGMDSPIAYTDKEGAVVNLSLTNRDLCLLENQLTRCFMDAKSRPMYIVVMRE